MVIGNYLNIKKSFNITSYLYTIKKCMFFEIPKLLANAMIIAHFLLLIVCLKCNNNTILGIH